MVEEHREVSDHEKNYKFLAGAKHLYAAKQTVPYKFLYNEMSSPVSREKALTT